LERWRDDRRGGFNQNTPPNPHHPHHQIQNENENENRRRNSKDVVIVKLPRSGGVVERSTGIRKRTRRDRISQYFHPPHLTMMGRDGDGNEKENSRGGMMMRMKMGSTPSPFQFGNLIERYFESSFLSSHFCHLILFTSSSLESDHLILHFSLLLHRQRDSERFMQEKRKKKKKKKREMKDQMIRFKG